LQYDLGNELIPQAAGPVVIGSAVRWKKWMPEPSALT
jgi:hypothetical protein